MATCKVHRIASPDRRAAAGIMSVLGSGGPAAGQAAGDLETGRLATHAQSHDLSRGLGDSMGKQSHPWHPLDLADTQEACEAYAAYVQHTGETDTVKWWRACNRSWPTPQ